MARINLLNSRFVPFSPPNLGAIYICRHLNPSAALVNAGGGRRMHVAFSHRSALNYSRDAHRSRYILRIMLTPLGLRNEFARLRGYDFSRRCAHSPYDDYFRLLGASRGEPRSSAIRSTLFRLSGRRSAEAHPYTRSCTTSHAGSGRGYAFVRRVRCDGGPAYWSYRPRRQADARAAAVPLGSKTTAPMSAARGSAWSALPCVPISVRHAPSSIVSICPPLACCVPLGAMVPLAPVVLTLLLLAFRRFRSLLKTSRTACTPPEPLPAELSAALTFEIARAPAGPYVELDRIVPKITPPSGPASSDHLWADAHAALHIAPPSASRASLSSPRGSSPRGIGLAPSPGAIRCGTSHFFESSTTARRPFAELKPLDIGPLTTAGGL